MGEFDFTGKLRSFDAACNHTIGSDYGDVKKTSVTVVPGVKERARDGKKDDTKH